LAGLEAYEYIDANPPRGAVDYWIEERGRAGDLTWHGPVTLASHPGEGTSFRLGTPHPNPFRDETRLALEAGGRVDVEAAVYDLRGRRVAVLVVEAPSGTQGTIRWDGTGDRGRAPAGLYFIRARAGAGEKVQKVLLLP
jgi:hypothetical protein